MAKIILFIFILTSSFCFASSKEDLQQKIDALKARNNPQNDATLDKLAALYHEQKNSLEEVRALELIHVDGKASPAELVRLGDAYTDIGKTKEAVDIFREAITKAPKYEKAYRGLYDLFMKNKRYDDARLLLMEVLDKFGKKKEWLDDYCRIDFEQKYFEDAKDVCQKAIAADPQMPDNHVYLALSFKSTGNDEQARKILFKAAQQFKKSEVTQWNAGQLSEEIKNWEQAEQQYDHCLEANSQSGRCYLQLGKVLFQLKKYELSLKSLLKACPLEKGVDVDMRRFSYELDKINQHQQAKAFMKETDKCDLVWFDRNKHPQK